MADRAPVIWAAALKQSPICSDGFASAGQGLGWGEPATPMGPHAAIPASAASVAYLAGRPSTADRERVASASPALSFLLHPRNPARPRPMSAGRIITSLSVGSSKRPFDRLCSISAPPPSS
jgi:hypothetical protein